jgi:hypothetical protein
MKLPLKPDGQSLWHFIHLVICLFKPDGHLIHLAIRLFKNRWMPIRVSLPCCCCMSVCLRKIILAQHSTGKMLDHWTCWGTHWEPKKNEKKSSPPSSSSQNLKGRKARDLECRLEPSIGCMKFLFPKEFVTIFGLGYLPKNTHTQLQRTAYLLTAVTYHVIIKGLASATHLDDRKTHLLTWSA